MFEITTLAAQETFTLELVGPSDEPLRDEQGSALSVTVYGPGSKAYQRASAARTQRLLDKMAKRGRNRLSGEEQLSEQAAFLAACTVSFNGWAYKGDPQAFEAAYADPAIGWIADQVAKAVGDWANFTKGSSKT